MSLEAEYIKWLCRPDKTFAENLQFAIKSLKSSEFTITTKYEITLKWFCDQIQNNYKEKIIDSLSSSSSEWKLIYEFLEFNFPLGLVKIEIKKYVIDTWIMIASSALLSSSKSSSPLLLKNVCGILSLLYSHTSYQDCFKFSHKIYCKLIKILIKAYENYIIQSTSASERNEGKEQQQQHQINVTIENQFFLNIITNLTDFIKGLPNTEEFETYFTKILLKPLLECYTTLKIQNLNYFDEILEILKIYFQIENEILLQNCIKFDYHINLIYLEFSIAFYHGHLTYFQELLKLIFDNLQNDEKYNENNDQIRFLTIAHVIDLLRKYDVQLNFQMNNENDNEEKENSQKQNNTETALQFLSKHIQEIVQNYYQSDLESVLLIVCNVIRLNPIILEKNILDILIKCMLTRKSNMRTYQRYEEFLQLVIEMFKKLSRSEKFVSHLLKLIKEYLKVNKLSKKLKRKIPINNDIDDANTSQQSKKKLKVDLDNSCTVSETRSIASECSADHDTKKYLEMLRREFIDKEIKQKNQQILSLSSSSSSLLNEWSCIDFAWPSQTIGLIFSKVITSLMFKPSLVIWKTLIFSLLEIFENDFQSIKSIQEIDENLLFLIDFNSSLFYQYLNGTHLPGQLHFHWQDIQQVRQITINCLKKFGEILLNFEHHNRLMKTFLKLCIILNEFDLICLYYLPDSIQHKLSNDNEIDNEILTKMKNLHYNHLTNDEWILIEQRILNFGNYDCKILLDTLNLQKFKLQLLYTDFISLENEKILNVKKFLSSSTLNDVEQLKAIFNATNPSSSFLSNAWLLKFSNHKQKLQICEILLQDTTTFLNVEFLKQFVENHEFFEIIIFNLYKLLSNCFNSKNSILSAINFDEILLKDDKVTLNEDVDQNDEIIEKIVKMICGKNMKYSIKHYSPEELEIVLKVLTSLPIGFCEVKTKMMVFVLNLSLYRDLIATKNTKLKDICFQAFKDLLHFGQQIKIFNYFTIENLLNFFPPSTSTEFYELIFNTFKRNVDDAELCLKKLVQILSTSDLNDIDYRKLTIVLIGSLSHQKSVKILKKYSDEIISIFIDYVNNFFQINGNNEDDKNDNVDNKEIANNDENDNGDNIKKKTKKKKIKERDSKKDKEFILETIPAYNLYISSYLGKINNSENHIDENVRRICKMYIAYSMDCNNSYAVKLISIAFTYKLELNFYADEIDFVLQEYWKQLERGFRDGNINLKNAETIIQLIVSHKSTEEFHKNLISLSEISNENEIEYICQILSHIAKCHLNSTKGAIFNEYFKKIIFNISLKLKRDQSTNTFQDYDLILRLLNCQKTLCENNKIPISVDHIDEILIFLMDINIKKFKIESNDTEKLFNSLHSSICGVCLALVKFRQTFLAERIPQFVYVFKDLLKSLCWYKSERNKNIEITEKELDDLEELALKLENLMHLLSLHSIDIKRVAPYLLTFTINLMVSIKRPITLYPKIKSHFESICLDLIAVCDHRVGSFILRCSNDATKQIYESLRKDYQKRKFKGKI